MTKKLSLIPLLTLALILTSCGTRRNVEQQTDVSEIREVLVEVEYEVETRIVITQEVETPPPLSVNVSNDIKGLVINGVRWATRNVDTPGTFVQNPENTGGLFNWYEAQNACPQGWRLPILEELRSLVNTSNEWTIKNSINGCLFGAESNQIFFPAAGWRNGDGSLGGAGVGGSYWSSSIPTQSTGWSLRVRDGDARLLDVGRAFGFSVRCVAK